MPKQAVSGSTISETGSSRKVMKSSVSRCPFMFSLIGVRCHCEMLQDYVQSVEDY